MKTNVWYLIGAVGGWAVGFALVGGEGTNWWAVGSFIIGGFFLGMATGRGSSTDAGRPPGVPLLQWGATAMLAGLAVGLAIGVAALFAGG